MTEKITFLGGITPSLREEYKERLKYKKLVNFEGLIDIWYKNFEYGLVNQHHEPVVLIEDENIIKNFEGIADNVGCLNFVTDSFVKFREEFINKINNSTIRFPSLVEGLIPVKGYESFENRYANWSAYSAVKYSSFLQEDKTINDYSCFLDSLKAILAQELANFPITKSGFCLSKHNDIKTTGLVVELANLDYNIDLQKGEMVQSLDFQCYLDFARKNGFYVDKNAPWRLIADLDHKEMRLQVRGTTSSADDESHSSYTTMEILNNIYRTRTHFDDLYVLQDFVLKIYNEIIKNVPFYTEMVYNSGNNTTMKKTIFRERTEFLSTEEWLNMLVFVRLHELGSYTEARYKNYTEQVSRSHGLYGVRHALTKLGTLSAFLIKGRLSK